MYVNLYPEKVRALREERKMSKRDLAAAAGVSAITARNAERGADSRTGQASSGASPFIL